MYRLLNKLFLSVVLITVISGCTGDSLPLLPGLELSPGPVTPAQNPGEKNSHYLWSYNLVRVETTEENRVSLEVIPLRIAQGHWNVLSWLENGPCFDCLKITGWSPSGTGSLLVDIELTHPFDLLNLTAFDVRGIVMFNGSRQFPYFELNLPDSDLGDGELLNAEGYSTLYNYSTAGSGPDGLQGYLKGKWASQTAPDALLNGYKRFITDGPENTRNAFWAGDSQIVTFEIKVPSGNFIFGYAIDASWVPPTIKPVVNPITDFPPEANCSEPWKIEVTDTPVGEGLTALGGETVVEVKVYDWQGVDSHHSPFLECPELFPGFTSCSLVSTDTGFSTWSATVTNELFTPAGEYELLVKVTDKDNAYSPDWLDLSAYQIYTLTVQPVPESDPVAKAKIAPPGTVMICQEIDFIDDGSFDPDGGDIVKYEWDWENDGTWDEEGSEVSHSWDTSGFYEVGFRVTDDEGKQSQLDPPLSFWAAHGHPVAVAEASSDMVIVNEPVEISGSGSYDTDCGGESIVQWEWDIGNDGTWEETGETIIEIFENTGHVFINLKATDDEGVGAVLETPLHIEVIPIPIPPVAIAEAVPSTQVICEDIFFDASESFDFDGYIEEYAWDFDGDSFLDYFTGENFAHHSYTVAGVYYAQLRVRDNHNVEDWLDSPIEITIENVLPTAVCEVEFPGVNPGQTARFSGEGSFDNDCGGGEITMCEWDWENDGTFEDNGFNVGHAFESGVYQVMMRVIDDEGGAGELDEPLNIIVAQDFGFGRAWINEEFIYEQKCLDICTDSEGNVFQLMSYIDLLDVDPGWDVVNYEYGPGSGTGKVLVKLRPNGTYDWAVQWVGNFTTHMLVEADNQGNIYFAGAFNYSGVDFDPGPGVELRTPQHDDAFLVKLNSSGQFQWVRTWDQDFYETIYEIAIDSVGNIYVCGFFTDTVDLDPGPGEDIYTSNGESDYYVSKFATNGDFLWAYASGSDKDDIARSVSIGESDYPYIFVSYRINMNDNHFELIKLDKLNGDVVWLRAWEGYTNMFSSGRVSHIKLDSMGNSYISAPFQGTVDFDPGPGVNELSAPDGEVACFLTSFDSAGNHRWVTSLPVFARGMGVAPDGACSIAGIFALSTDFDPGPGEDYHISNGDEDCSLSSYDSNGNYLWTAAWGGTDGDYTNAVDTDANGDIYTSGQFRWLMDIDPGPWEQWVYGGNNNYFDAFMIKFLPDGSW